MVLGEAAAARRMNSVTWKISENCTRTRYRPSVAGRKKHVRMGPVGVCISADSVSLMILPFSDLFDGREQAPHRSHMGRDDFDREKSRLLPLHRDFSGRMR